MVLRLSHSQIEVFENCKRNYFYKYVQKFKEREVETKWMHFGSAMHKVLEDFYSSKNPDWQNNLIERWKDYKLEGRMDFNLFKTCVINAIFLAPKCNKVEEKFFINIDDFSFVGFVDILNEDTGEILDWKSGSFSQDKVDSYKRQLITYCYLYYKRYEKMPSTASLFFNKVNKKITFFVEKEKKRDNISYQEILDYEGYVKIIARDIEERKKKELKEELWEQNTKACLFCGYKYLCFNSGDIMRFKITIQNGLCFLSGHVNEYLLEGIDRATRFDLKNKHFMQEMILRKNRGRRPNNFLDIGTVHLFNKRYKAFGIGMIPKIKTLLEDYCEFNKKKLYLEIEDKRESTITEKKLNIMPAKLKTEKELRPYQIESIESFINFGGIGYLEIATSGGKTLVTAELIRLLDTPTLWIIDRKELLYQTKEEFEAVLGIECGIIGDGELNIKDITLATIQTLNKKCLDKDEEIKKYLNSVNFVIVDEGHHAASSSYNIVFKDLINTKYRLGTTGTAKRDDCMEPIMFSLLGEIIYKISAEELIALGYLMKPEVTFYKLNKECERKYEYAEDYRASIVENEERNDLIIKIAEENKDKKILILTKLIDHGEALNEAIKGSFYIHGSLDKEKRKEYMRQFKENDAGVLIATISIASEGINIPDLHMIINAGANKGDVKSVQVLGRVLRKIEDKKDAKYIDFLDVGKFTKKHSNARIKILKKEGHSIQFK